ncbi:MAG: TerB family tellurite resistance protein [Magnetovibrionaceae bacterium]
MGVWGKIIGAGAGFVVGGPIGAIVGAVGGHVIDKLRGPSGPGPDGESIGARPGFGEAARQSAFAVTVIVLSAKMAKADGVVTAEEISTFKRLFKVPPEDMGQVAKIWNRAKDEAGGFEAYAEQAAKLFRHEPAVLEELLNGLYHIAMADGEFHPSEEAFLRRVNEIFGFDERVFERIRATGGRSTSSTDGPDPYDVLGVSRTDDNDAIKAAYRKLVRENHPDKLMAEGVPAEFIEMANEKLAAINVAYDTIQRERGIN